MQAVFSAKRFQPSFANSAFDCLVAAAYHVRPSDDCVATCPIGAE